MECIAESKMHQLSINLLSGRLVFSSSQAVSRPRYARMQRRTGSAPQSVRRRQPSRQSGRLDTGGSEVESGEDGPQAGRYPFPQESSVQCETKTHQRLTLRSFQDAEHGIHVAFEGVSKRPTGRRLRPRRTAEIIGELFYAFQAGGRTPWQVMLNEYAAETRDPDARSRSVKQLIVMSLSVA
jgi:hypothetical protein